MAYETLEKLFHKDASAERFARNEQLARERLDAESSFRIGLASPAGELFFAVPRELSLLNEQVLCLERHVCALADRLPPVALGALVRSLVVDEVVCTNELEGVHSTRRQISDLLESDLAATRAADTAAQGAREAAGHRRFRELAKLYLGLSEPEHPAPQTPSDIRALYDRVMLGEDLGADAPDGVLFRKGRVDVIGAGQKVLHEGLYPESAIEQAMRVLIALANADDVPATYGAAAAHYLFEYAHPFYDGNGRTGRYLLALHLGRSLSTLTTLSLSRAIAENRSRHYRAFKEAESPLNHGELTSFVLTLLAYVHDAQEGLVADLEAKGALLAVVEHRVKDVRAQAGLTEAETSVLLQLAQRHLFGAFPDMALAELSGNVGLGCQQTRRHVRALEEKGLVSAASRRPLRFVLTEGALARLGLPRYV